MSQQQTDPPKHKMHEITVKGKQYSALAWTVGDARRFGELLAKIRAIPKEQADTPETWALSYSFYKDNIPGLTDEQLEAMDLYDEYVPLMSAIIEANQPPKALTQPSADSSTATTNPA